MDDGVSWEELVVYGLDGYKLGLLKDVMHTFPEMFCGAVVEDWTLMTCPGCILVPADEAIIFERIHLCKADVDRSAWYVPRNVNWEGFAEKNKLKGT